MKHKSLLCLLLIGPILVIAPNDTTDLPTRPTVEDEDEASPSPSPSPPEPTRKAGQAAHGDQTATKSNVTSEKPHMTSDEATMVLGSGIALFLVMYISLFIPIDKSGPRILCILIPLNLSLMFSRRMRRRGPDYEPDVNQPCDIFFFVIFWFGAMHFIEYLVAFTSIARITNEINRDREVLEEFVYTQEEASDANDPATKQASNASLTIDGKDKDSPNQVLATEPKVEIHVPDNPPAAHSSKKAEIRVPDPQNTGVPTLIKVPSLEAAALRKKFRTRSIRYADGNEYTETDILPASSSESESDTTGTRQSSSQETLPLNPDEEDVDGRYRPGQLKDSWATIPGSGKTRRKHRHKTSDEQMQPIISYVPADVAARHYYLWSFAFILYIFCVIYIL